MSREKTNMAKEPVKSRIYKLVLTGMLFAVAIVLSVVENSLPLPMPVPGVKLGLSNIVVMYVLFFLGRGQALSIVFLKALFSVLTRGMVAGILSLSGGLLSVGVMSLIMLITVKKASYFVLGMFGALCHNIGQFLAIVVIYRNNMLIYYLPVLLVAGVIAGFITSILLRYILPALKRLGLE